MEIGAGINQRWIPIHRLAAALEERCGGLFFWYAFTGCDNVSDFGEKGKLKPWATWQVLDEGTPVFARYSKPCHSFNPYKDSVQVIERFTCLRYDGASAVEDANNCPRKLFTNRGRSVDDIPLTSIALVQHIRGALNQAG